MTNDQALMDVAIVGGGPAGSAAALQLGRARKRVLLFDAGTPRNVMAEEIHGFLTRDGTPPAEFKRLAREEVRTYPNVDVRSERVTRIERDGRHFRLETEAGAVRVRKVLLTAGVVDEMPTLPGFRELWGHDIFTCPYCHGWEARDRAWGYLAPGSEWIEHGLFFRGWTRDFMIFTNGLPLAPAVRERLKATNVPVEERRIVGVRAEAGRLRAVQLEDGSEVLRDVLVARPEQRQTDMVAALGLACDEMGFVRVSPMGETSEPGIYAAGDLTTKLQGALMGAGAAVLAASMLNHALTIELVSEGAL